jgi:hypothetical protein
MARGPGKYDDVATMALQETRASGVIVIVLGGDRGSGFSVQAVEGVVLDLPQLLRTTADQIEKDLQP